MPSFTVHTPASRDDEERAVFISDVWSWPAFIFGPFWLGWHRQWLALLGYAALWIALNIAGRYLGLHPVASSLLSTLINIGLALEGSQIRRWTLARQGAPAVAVVNAPKESDAEIKFFVARQQLARQSATRADKASIVPAAAASAAAATAPPSSPAPWSGQQSPRIIGSFPEPGGR